MPFAMFPQGLRRWPRRLGEVGLAGLLGVGALWLAGDFGLTQQLLDGAERRALAGHPTLADKWGLRLLYTTLQVGGRVVYPQAAGLLNYYVAGQGDTLRFNALPLLHHSEVREALRLRKPGITFQCQARGGPFYVARHTDWGLFYAFDLLYIRPVPGGVVFFDNYFFQPVARRSYTRFAFGRLRVKLNDGLIHVAYSHAKPFIAYGSVKAT